MFRPLIATGALVAVALVSPYAPSAQASPGAKTYKNCTALNKVYPHGVGKVGAKDHVSSGKPVTNFTRNTRVYNANTARDRDGDKVACEKK